MRVRALLASIVPAAGLAIAMTTPARAQSLSLDRQRGAMMLDTMKHDLREQYYDPGFHGLDLDARVEAAKQRIATAGSLGEIFGIVAQVAADLNDSHTRFLPPQRANDVDYGWITMFVGDAAYVRYVDKNSDAAHKGLKVGDRVLQVGQFTLTRDNESTLWYLLRALRPQPSLRVVVQSAGEAPRVLDLAATIRTSRAQLDLRDENAYNDYLMEQDRRRTHERRHEHVALNDRVHVWRMPYFDLESSEVDSHFAKLGQATTLILDLRGNGGGSEEAMLRVLSNLFDHDVTVGTIHEKQKERPLVAKTRGQGRTFAGRLFVLIDADSASASEVVARVVQLEHRGTVVGDRSNGSVMRAVFVPHKLGTEVAIYWAMELTVADLTNIDGRSLEHVGVTPDRLDLPSQDDCAARRDPVLAHVAGSLDISLDPDKAAALFARRD